MPISMRPKASMKPKTSRASQDNDGPPIASKRLRLAKNFVAEKHPETKKQNRANVQPLEENDDLKRDNTSVNLVQLEENSTTLLSASTSQGNQSGDKGVFFNRPQPAVTNTETNRRFEFYSYLKLVNSEFPVTEENDNIFSPHRRSYRVRYNMLKKEKQKLEKELQSKKQALSTDPSTTPIDNPAKEDIIRNSKIITNITIPVSCTIVRPETETEPSDTIVDNSVDAKDADKGVRPADASVIEEAIQNNENGSDSSGSWTYIGDYQVPKIRTRSRTSSHRSNKQEISSIVIAKDMILKSRSLNLKDCKFSCAGSKKTLLQSVSSEDKEVTQRNVRVKWHESIINKLNSKKAKTSRRRKYKGRRSRTLWRKSATETKTEIDNEPIEEQPAIKEQCLRKTLPTPKTPECLDTFEDNDDNNSETNSSKSCSLSDKGPVKRWITQWSGENHDSDERKQVADHHSMDTLDHEQICRIIGVRYVPHKLDSPPKVRDDGKDLFGNSISNVNLDSDQNKSQSNDTSTSGIISVRYVLNKQVPLLFNSSDEPELENLNSEVHDNDNLGGSDSVSTPISPADSFGNEFTNAEHNYCRYDDNANDVTLPTTGYDHQEDIYSVREDEYTSPTLDDEDASARDQEASIREEDDVSTKEGEAASTNDELQMPAYDHDPALNPDTDTEDVVELGRFRSLFNLEQSRSPPSLWRRTYARPLKRNKTLLELQAESEVGVPSAKNHSIAIQPSLGEVIYCCYFKSYLVVAQEHCVGLWIQSGLGSFLESQSKWISMGSANRSQFDSDTNLCYAPESLLYTVLTGVAYVELWTKEHRLDTRQMPGCDLFVVVYFRRRGDLDLQKRLLQLTKITGYASNVSHVLMKQQNCIVVGFRELSGTASVAQSSWRLQCFFLREDYQNITGVKDFTNSPHPILSLHYVDGCDVLMGGGGDVLSVWNSNELVHSIKLSEQVTNVTCKTDRGFIFVLQKEKKDNTLILLAINAQDFSWKRLRAYHTPMEFINFKNAYIKDGEVIGFFENGRVCWNAESGRQTMSILDPDTKCWSSGDWVISIQAGFVHVNRAWKTVRIGQTMESHTIESLVPSQPGFAQPGTSKQS